MKFQFNFLVKPFHSYLQVMLSSLGWCLSLISVQEEELSRSYQASFTCQRSLSGQSTFAWHNSNHTNTGDAATMEQWISCWTHTVEGDVCADSLPHWLHPEYRSAAAAYGWCPSGRYWQLSAGVCLQPGGMEGGSEAGRGTTCIKVCLTLRFSNVRLKVKATWWMENESRHTRNTHLVGLHGVHVVLLQQHFQHVHTAVLCGQAESPVSRLKCGSLPSIWVWLLQLK